MEINPRNLAVFREKFAFSPMTSETHPEKSGLENPTA
jgi:hypothetical protein